MIEKNMNCLKDSVDRSREDLLISRREVKGLQSQLLENTRVLGETKKRLNDMENRMMRENLIITGVPEIHNENTESCLKSVIKDKMRIDDNIEFERVHRIGQTHPSRHGPRAIVAKFSRYKDKEYVRTNSRNLKGTNIRVHE